MKATSRTERFYDIEIGGVMKEGWRETSTWNGLQKLERPGEQMIVVTESHLAMFELFASIMGQSNDVDLHIISASPSLHEWIKSEVV